MKFYSVLSNDELNKLRNGAVVKSKLWTKDKAQLNIHTLRVNPFPPGTTKIPKDEVPEYVVTVDIPQATTRRFYIDSSDPRAVTKPIPPDAIVSVQSIASLNKPKVSIEGTSKSPLSKMRVESVPSQPKSEKLSKNVYSDRKGERLARKHHRGWTKVKLT